MPRHCLVLSCAVSGQGRRALARAVAESFPVGNELVVGTGGSHEGVGREKNELVVGTALCLLTQRLTSQK